MSAFGNGCSLATMLRMHSFLLWAAVTLSLLLPVCAQAEARSFPVPEEMRSQRFTMTLDGNAAPVAHAATTYEFASFEIRGDTTVAVTASTDQYWAAGVEVQPWRWGIRPTIQGRTITFTVREPGKFSISRPGDHGATAEMLFLFANAPEPDVPSPDAPGIQYIAAGVHRESINARTGDRIYLAPGAVVFGSINIWNAENVRIWGRGTVVYDGPQNPKNDEGWMHKPDWHVVVTDHARDVQISGLTLIVRSRTWMIQLLSSRNLLFDNIKVIGGCPGNANQDGIDWLGGGDTIVRDSFFRASDDIFALYGNWLGYSEEALTTPGEDVRNIVIEKCVLSTSISNIVRVSWPKKIFNSHNFTLRDSDVIHMGQGGCKVPFALLEIWADPGGHGEHTDFTFEDIRLENWYSLLQLYQAKPAIRRVNMHRIWALGTPQLVPTVQQGDIADVSLSESNAVDVPMGSAFTYSADDFAATKPVHFEASAPGSSYHWIFGDGSTADGKSVDHAFLDTAGTLRDGSGRYRVLLQTTDAVGHTRWEARWVALVQETSAASSGPLHVSKDGGYTFHLVANEPAKVIIDGSSVMESPAPKPQVCGSIGNMAQVVVKSTGLKAGEHSIVVERTHGAGPDNFALWWEGPGLALTKIPVQ